MCWLSCAGFCLLLRLLPPSLFYHSITRFASRSPVHCEVDEWSEWSPCSRPGKTCGFKRGEETRTRKVIQTPSLLGHACPPTYEKRECVVKKKKCPGTVYQSLIFTCFLNSFLFLFIICKGFGGLYSNHLKKSEPTKIWSVWSFGPDTCEYALRLHQNHMIKKQVGYVYVHRYINLWILHHLLSFWFSIEQQVWHNMCSIFQSKGFYSCVFNKARGIVQSIERELSCFMSN